MATKCKGSEAPVGVGGKCLYALEAYPMGKAIVDLNRILSMVGFLFLFIYAVNRLLYSFEQRKFRKKPVGRIITIVLLILPTACLTGFALRIDDWVAMSEHGYRAYTLLFTISQGCSLLTVAFLVMNFADRHLLKVDKTRVVKSYTLVTKIVCLLFIGLALAQVIFYAAISIKYKGTNLKYVRDSHIITLSTQCLIIVLACVMFLVGPIIAWDHHATKQVRFRASATISWAVCTIFIAAANIYVIKKFLLTTYEPSKELSLLFYTVVKAQLPAGSYLVPSTILLIATLAQLVANLYLLGFSSNELLPGESTARWSRYAVTGEYHGYDDVGTSDHSVYNSSTRRDASATDDFKASPVVRRTDYSRRTKTISAQPNDSDTSSGSNEDVDAAFAVDAARATALTLEVIGAIATDD